MYIYDRHYGASHINESIITKAFPDNSNPIQGWTKNFRPRFGPQIGNQKLPEPLDSAKFKIALVIGLFNTLRNARNIHLIAYLLSDYLTQYFALDVSDTYMYFLKKANSTFLLTWFVIPSLKIDQLGVTNKQFLIKELLFYLI